MRAPLLIPGLVAFIGAMLGIHLPVDSIVLVVIIGSMCVCAGLFVVKWKPSSPFQLSQNLFLFTALLAAFAVYTHTKIVRPLLLDSPVDASLHVVLVDQPQVTRNGFRCRVQSINDPHYRFIAYFPKLYRRLNEGDTLFVQGSIVGFDRDGIYHSQSPLYEAIRTQSHAKLFVRSILSSRFAKQKSISSAWMKLCDAVREQIRSPLQRHLHGEPAILADAMLFGDYLRIHPDTVAGFRQSGLIHLLAISGLQLFFLWGLIEALASILHISATYRSLLVIGILLAYRALLPDIPSVDRSIIMVFWWQASRLSGYRISKWQAWGGALFVMLLWKPEDAINIGFQLSFAAVAGLLFAGNLVARVLPKRSHVRRPKPGEYVLRALIYSLGAVLTTMPLLVWHFGYLSVSGIVLNIIAIPFSEWLLVGTLLTIFFAPIPVLSGWMGWMTQRCGEWLIAIANIPGISWGPGYHSSWLLFVAVVLLLVGIPMLDAKRWKFALIPVVGGLMLISFASVRHAQVPPQIARELLPVSGRSIAVTTNAYQASQLTRKWLRDCGKQPLTVVVLESNSSLPSLQFPSIRLIDVSKIEYGNQIEIDSTLTYTSLYATQNKRKHFSRGYVSVHDTIHYLVHQSIPNRQWKRLSWEFLIPTGIRMTLVDESIPESGEWFRIRWNAHENG